MNRVRLIHADVLAGLAMLPDESVQCCITSPPYWGLRDYGLEPQVWGGEEECGHEWEDKSRYWDNRAGSLMRDEGTVDFSGKKDTRGHIKSSFCRLCGAWRGSYGLEPTIELYVQHTVEIFRGVRRVLRKDGVLFLNLGDSYNGSGGAGGDYNPGGLKEGQPKFPGRRVNGLKPKDLCGIPWRVALALQADGWYLRSDIIWAKPNPMPESCTDRPTTAHEHIFLLTKSAKYFYDAEVVRKTSVGQNNHDLTGPGYLDPGQSPQTGRRVKAPDGWATHPGGHGAFHKDGREAGAPGFIRHGRNLRSVWTIATAPFPQAHFATFPPAIPERCIKAGTSERGCCPKCGAPWKRVATEKASKGGHGYKVETTGWTPTCTCEERMIGKGFGGEGKLITAPFIPIPCTVLDPFSGAGTTALVAAKLGRDAIGIELNPEYVEMSRKRILGEMGMLAEIEVDTPGEIAV